MHRLLVLMEERHQNSNRYFGPLRSRPSTRSILEVLLPTFEVYRAGYVTVEVSVSLSSSGVLVLLRRIAKSGGEIF